MYREGSWYLSCSRAVTFFCHAIHAAVFNIYDENGSGHIATEHIPSILEKLGRNATEGERRVMSYEALLALSCCLTLS